MNTDAIFKAAGMAVIGAAVGWAGNALTLGGRVGAMEAALMRIEMRLDRMTGASAPAGQSAK